jgi:3-hydroxy-3-methylglutaryl CoA synthase
MVGIKSYGIYIPIYRLKREKIANEWGRYSFPGEKAVANYDEDSITMAVESGFDCLENQLAHSPNRPLTQSIDSLLFATTTSPYKEKLSSSTIATALDLKREIHTADITGSTRSATIALKFAIDSVKSGSCKNVLICCSDSRLALPNSDYELIFGDGSASIVLGCDDVVAEIKELYSLNDEFLNLWRKDGDIYVETGDDKFSRIYGYHRCMGEAIRNILKSSSLNLSSFKKIVLSSPDLRSYIEFSKRKR